jgi:hypothetical protein
MLAIVLYRFVRSGGGKEGTCRTFSGFMFFCALFIVRDDWAIMAVMRFMALLAWIWATDSSAMSAAWSICLAMACLARSMRAFW